MSAKLTVKPSRKTMTEKPWTDAQIERGIASDPDTFTLDADWFKRAKLVMPKLVMPKAKEAVTIRVDANVLQWFRKAGPGYQTRINAVLKAFVEAHGRKAS